MLLHDRLVFESIEKVYDEEVLTSEVEYTNRTNSDNNTIKLGSACSNEAVFNCIDFDNNIRELYGEKFSYYKLSGGVYTKVGEFTCQRPVRNSDGTYKITAYDNIYLMDKSAYSWLINLQLPITLKNFAIALCQQCGLEFLVTDDFLNQDFQIVAGSFDFSNTQNEKITYRDLLSQVAEAAGCYACADEDGRIKLSWYHKNTNIVITPSEGAYRIGDFVGADEKAIITKDGKIFKCVAVYSLGYMSGSMEYTDFVNDNNIKFIGSDSNVLKTSDDKIFLVFPHYQIHKITGVGISIVSASTTSRETEYVYSTDALTVEDANTYYIDKNLLLQYASREELVVVANNLELRLSDVVYIPCSCQLLESHKIKAGQIVPVTTHDGARFNMYVMELKISSRFIDVTCYGSDYLADKDY